MNRSVWFYIISLVMALGLDVCVAQENLSIESRAAVAAFNSEMAGEIGHTKRAGNTFAGALGDAAQPVGTQFTITALSPGNEWSLSSFSGKALIATTCTDYIFTIIAGIDPGISLLKAGNRAGYYATCFYFPGDSRQYFVYGFSFNVLSSTPPCSAVQVVQNGQCVPLVTQASAAISTPANGSTLSGATQTFTWTNVGASLYAVAVGNSVGTSDLGTFPAAGTTSTTTSVSGLPTDGRTVYVRLYWQVSGAWYSSDYTYKASGTASVTTAATITSPANGSILSGATQTFTWNNAGATLYFVYVGSSVGAFDLGYFPTTGTTATTTTITGLPTDGRTLYVRLLSNMAGTWKSNDYTYKAATPVVPAASMTNPANGSTLSGGTQTFTWSDAGASLYYVYVGSSVGGTDRGIYPEGGTAATTTTITGLPTNGSTIYVRLLSNIAGTWKYNDYTYKASFTVPTKNDSLWTYNETQDVLTGKLTSGAFTYFASGIWQRSLNIRCTAGTTFDIFVVTGEYIGSSNPSVLYSVDHGTVSNETWFISTTGTAAFSKSPSAVASKLMGGDVLGIVVTNYAGTPISMSFPISTTYLLNIMGRCGLSP